MNWRLVFSVSLLGLLMAVVTIYLTPSAFELFLWLGIFLLCAYLLAKYADENYFVHGLFAGILICSWVSIADLFLFNRYYITHHKEVDVISNMGVTNSVHSTLLILGPAAGLFVGSFIGLFALVIAKITNPKTR